MRRLGTSQNEIQRFFIINQTLEDRTIEVYFNY